MRREGGRDGGRAGGREGNRAGRRHRELLDGVEVPALDWLLVHSHHMVVHLLPSTLVMVPDANPEPRPASFHARPSAQPASSAGAILPLRS